MANWPDDDAPLSYDTTLSPDYLIRGIEMDDGTFARQSIGPFVYYTFTLVTVPLTSDQYDALRIWLSANARYDNTVTIDGTIYIIQITNVEREQIISGGYRVLTITARGRAQ